MSTFNNDRVQEQGPVQRQYDAPNKSAEESLGHAAFKNGLRADTKATVLHDRATSVDAHMGGYRVSSEGEKLADLSFDANKANQNSVTAMANRYVEIASLADPQQREAAYQADRQSRLAANYKKVEGQPYARVAASIATNNEVKPMRHSAEVAVAQGRGQEFVQEVHHAEMSRASEHLKKQTLSAQQVARTQGDQKTIEQSLALASGERETPRPRQQAPAQDNWREDWKKNQAPSAPLN